MADKQKADVFHQSTLCGEHFPRETPFCVASQFVCVALQYGRIKEVRKSNHQGTKTAKKREGEVKSEKPGDEACPR